MKKLIMAIAICSLAVTGIACSDDGGGGGGGDAGVNACLATWAALDECTNTFQGTTTETDASASCGLVPGDASFVAYYDCQAAAYDDQDCATQEGLTAAQTAAAACPTP